MSGGLAWAVLFWAPEGCVTWRILSLRGKAVKGETTDERH
jgi:hypothetical protein